MRSVTFSPPPPTQMGGRVCTGLGYETAPSSQACRPWKVASGWVQSALATSMVSSSSSRRWPAVGNVQPWEWYSSSYQPAPIPKIRRPPDITSTVAAIFASRAGFR